MSPPSEVVCQSKPLIRNCSSLLSLLGQTARIPNSICRRTLQLPHELDAGQRVVGRRIGGQAVERVAREQAAPELVEHEDELGRTPA